jgi:hypothetical protein
MMADLSMFDRQTQIANNANYEAQYAAMAVRKGGAPTPAGFAGCLPLIRARPSACARMGRGLRG